MALRKLSEYLHRYHNKKVIILIDEYDKPVNHAYINGFSKEAMAFLSVALTGALKDNTYDIQIIFYFFARSNNPVDIYTKV